MAVINRGITHGRRNEREDGGVEATGNIEFANGN